MAQSVGTTTGEMSISVKGLKGNLQTDYILKILGLDICADIHVGNAMRRGISGGQKKRLTTGDGVITLHFPFKLQNEF
ncbi:hypothetical protein COLO4_16201 [Corchorus olitorius]|uniref:Uncharacterized protein n=1 Tax=Corchorus olitorius TaxID=93759 RepID=A0A1R3JIM0_9ROSI|nr:hypothetical protein COLO4_16201 [Corchorus olitorius]